MSTKFALEAKIGILGYSSFKPDVAGAVSTKNFALGLNLNIIALG